MKMEIGKKYRYKGKKSIYTCTGFSPRGNPILETSDISGEFVVQSTNDFESVIEKKSTWLNMYPNAGYPSLGAAIKGSGLKQTGIIRVDWEDGVPVHAEIEKV